MGKTIQDELREICIEKEIPEELSPEPICSTGLTAIKLALMELDLRTALLEKEIEEMETHFDNITARLDSIIKAREALNKVVEMGVGKSD